MPLRGQPDFGMYAPKAITASISDVGELAARLGSIIIFDRRGEVVDFDNFEEPLLRWVTGAFDGSVYFHNVDVKSGSQSLALSTDAVEGAYAVAIKYLALTTSRRLGAEISVGGQLIGLIYLKFYYYDSLLTYAGLLKFDYDNWLLYIWDEDAYDYVLIADLGEMYVGEGLHFFQTFKLVCDFETGKYVRVLYGNREWDISTIRLWHSTESLAPHLVFMVHKDNVAALACLTSIDDFIFTQAEP